MGKQPAIAQVFEYCPGAVNLVGFPRSRVLDGLSATLGQEVSLKSYQTEVGRRKVVVPSFPLGYIENRQKFFQRLPEVGIRKSLFGSTFPRGEDARYSVENFFYFCDRVCEALDMAREELKYFGHMSEAKSILRRINGFDGELEATLRALNALDEAHTFAVDTQSGVIINIDKMPAKANDAPYQADKADKSGWEREGIFAGVRVKMKKAVLEIARQGRVDFKKRIVRLVRDEFDFDPEADNLRRNFEQLAVPVRLYARYRRFLELCEEETAPAVYPQFASHYDIKNLFPPSLLNQQGAPEYFVPIDFKTKGSEKKFLLSGLHSGGKSFFLENIVLASVLGQLGVSMPAGSLTLPRYNRIFYYRNVDNSGSRTGKLETEMGEISGIISQAEEGDLLVFDEFLDSTTTGVATFLCPELLARMGKLKASVFVSTHRNTDYGELQKNGWVIISPEHEVKRGKIVPAHRLKRGIPDERVNRRYVREKLENIFNQE